MKKYFFRPYNEIFPSLFQNEKERILSGIQQDILIEHVGSTAVPGLGGKGVIDILVATEALQLKTVSLELEKLGYEYKPYFNSADHLYFTIDLPDTEEGLRRYHLHLTHLESQVIKDFIIFRDTLRADARLREEYAELKKQAIEFSNEEGKKYRALKDPFFSKLLKG